MSMNKPSPDIRLYVRAPLTAGNDVVLSVEQTHYLKNVMRCSKGDTLLLFNGADGEWRVEVTGLSKKGATVAVQKQTRPQKEQPKEKGDAPPDIWLIFAPVKKVRVDFIAQKATEMGVSKLVPVITRYTQNGKSGSAKGGAKIERLRANAIEAAEQCGLLHVPEVSDAIQLEKLLSDWDNFASTNKDANKMARKLIFCDENAACTTGLAQLKTFKGKPVAVLIGPEGGFAPEERAMLALHSSAHIISLGPRILRSDTAAIAALAAVQLLMGDWS